MGKKALKVFRSSEQSDLGPKLIMFSPSSSTVINQPNDKQNIFIDSLLSLWAHAYERYTSNIIDFLKGGTRMKSIGFPSFLRLLTDRQRVSRVRKPFTRRKNWDFHNWNDDERRKFNILSVIYFIELCKSLIGWIIILPQGGGGKSWIMYWYRFIISLPQSKTMRQVARDKEVTWCH